MKLPPAFTLLFVSACSTCANAEAVGNELVRIHLDLILARDAAEARNIDHVGNRFQLLLDDPIFQRFQLHQIVLRVGALQRVPIQLPDWTVVGPDCGLQVVRQTSPRQPLQHLLPVPIVLRFIVEIHGHDR